MIAIIKKLLVAIAFGVTLGLPIALIIFSWDTPLLSNEQAKVSECPIARRAIPNSAFVSSDPKANPSWLKIFPVPLVLIEGASHVNCFLSPRLGSDDLLWGENGDSGDKKALLTAISHSLGYLQTGGAAKAYQHYPVPVITQERVFRSLKRFRELLLQSNSPTELLEAVKREFIFYQSVGKTGWGNVLFTAYYEPVYTASRVPTLEYRYPIYRLPPDIARWLRPRPTREQLEGKDGLQGSQGLLRGLELFWLHDRLEPFMMQIEGSARLQLTDGTQTTVGYAGDNAYPYTSIGRELANDGKLPLQGLTMPKIIKYFQEHPAELNNYLPRDRSFVFFQNTNGSPATGSINVSLTAERSIATDKSLMPPGALALIYAGIPFPKSNGVMEYRLVSRYVLDQDTGGAITGPGRVDYFLGTGKLVGSRADVTVGNGQIFYLLLKQ